MNPPSSQTSPPRYSKNEEWLNILTHGWGVIAVTAGLIPLIIAAARSGALAVWAVGIYGATLLAMYTSSMLYHAANDDRRRRLFRRADHCSIYLLIAGTYTPLMLLAVGGNWGRGIMIAVWSLAAIGIMFKLFSIGRFKKMSLVLYLTMGWLCLLCIRQIFANLSTPAIILLLAGGVFYTAGVLFYINRRPYFHAVWHFFVLGGTISHFFMVRALL